MARNFTKWVRKNDCREQIWISAKRSLTLVLNSYLTPDSEWYENGEYRNNWLADVDGSYGENDQGIFFFTPDGKYIEWTGIYLYSDIPFEVTTPTIVIGGESSE